MPVFHEKPAWTRVRPVLAQYDRLPTAIVQELSRFGDIRDIRKVVTSFHETYLVAFAEPIRTTPQQTFAYDSRDHTNVIVQILYAELVDRAVFDVRRSVSASLIKDALTIARNAHVRVPGVLASASLSARGEFRNLSWICYEYIEAETLDRSIQPEPAEWGSIVQTILSRFDAYPLDHVDTGCLPRYDTVYDFIDSLIALATQANAAALVSDLSRLTTMFHSDWNIVPTPPVLLHQDLNRGNILCSRSPATRTLDGQSWQLDALIDFETAAVGDARLVTSRDTPWRLLRAFAHVVKFRWLEHIVSTGQRGPRCDMYIELQENHEMSMETLSQAFY